MDLMTILGLVAVGFTIAAVSFFIGFLSGLAVRDEIDNKRGTPWKLKDTKELQYFRLSLFIDGSGFLYGFVLQLP